MKEKSNKIIFFTKTPIPDNEEFYNSLTSELSLKKKNKQKKVKDKIGNKREINIELNINPIHFEADDENYYIFVQSTRLEFGMKEKIKDYDLEKFKKSFNKILDIFNRAYLDVFRVGYIFSWSEDEIKSIQKDFLNTANSFKLQFNKKEIRDKYNFNNNTLIIKEESKKELKIIQDYNSVVTEDYTFKKEKINTIFDELKNNFYLKENLKNIIFND